MAVARYTIVKLRVPEVQRDLIDRAARLHGKTRTAFMLEASREKAQQVLLDQTLFVADAKQLKAFAALMDAPISGNSAVGRLLARRAQWED